MLPCSEQVMPLMDKVAAKWHPDRRISSSLVLCRPTCVTNSAFLANSGVGRLGTLVFYCFPIGSFKLMTIAVARIYN